MIVRDTMTKFVLLATKRGVCDLKYITRVEQ